MKMVSNWKGLIVGLGAVAAAIAVAAAEDPPSGAAPPGSSGPPMTTPAPMNTPAKPAAKPTAADFRVDKPGAAVAAIYAALAKDCKVEFANTSLRDAFDLLSDTHGVRVLFDTRVVSEDIQNASITLTMSNVPMSAVLDRILDSQKLDWVIRDNVLLVTTPRRAANLLETHYYDLSKLGRVNGTPADIVDLIGQLQEDRVPDDLNAQEQVPEATKKVLNQNNLLIVRDNRRGHEMIEKLLVAMAATAPEEETTSVVPIPRTPNGIPGVTPPRGPVPSTIPMGPRGQRPPPPLPPDPPSAETTRPAPPAAPAPPGAPAPPASPFGLPE